MTGPDFDPVVVRAVYPPPRRIAIIGLSDRIGRPSHDVAGALLRWGYEVVPVNPGRDTILHQTCYPDLAHVPGPVDIVDVFRRSEHLEDHAEDILAKMPVVLWLQDGVRDDRLAARARALGILVVQDDCIGRRVGGWRRPPAATH